MNKLRIFIFVCLAVILFSACKSVPQPPAEIAVEPAPVLSQMPESAAENKSQNTGLSDVSLNTKAAAQPELSPQSKPSEQPRLPPELSPAQPKLSFSKPSEESSKDSGAKSTQSALSLKPKAAVSSGKTAASDEQSAVLPEKSVDPPEESTVSPRKFAASPMLKPVRAKPEPKKMPAESASAESASAEAEQPAEKIKSAEKMEPQEKNPEKEPENAPKPSGTSEALPPDSGVQTPSIPASKTPPEMTAQTTGAKPHTALPEKELPAASPVKSALSVVSSSVFDEPEVIVHTDTDDFTEENEAEEVHNEEPIEPSRLEEVELNESFDILYEGKNWIFLGEKNQTMPPVVRFSKRSFSGNNTVFSLHAVSEGETILHFYKHDVLENAARNEYVLVRVAGVTPPPAASLSNTASASGTDEEIVLPLSDSGFQPENTVSAEEMYTQAEKAFDEKKYADALRVLDDFFQHFTPSDNYFDSAVFLKGRIYETPSEYRNIRMALDEYKKITAFLPESGLYDEAERRITYINRFYMDIR